MCHSAEGGHGRFPWYQVLILSLLQLTCSETKLAFVWAGALELVLSLRAFVFRFCYSVISPVSLNMLGFK